MSSTSTARRKERQQNKPQETHLPPGEGVVHLSLAHTPQTCTHTQHRETTGVSALLQVWEGHVGSIQGYREGTSAILVRFLQDAGDKRGVLEETGQTLVMHKGRLTVSYFFNTFEIFL